MCCFSAVSVKVIYFLYLILPLGLHYEIDLLFALIATSGACSQRKQESVFKFKTHVILSIILLRLYEYAYKPDFQEKDKLESFFLPSTDDIKMRSRRRKSRLIEVCNYEKRKEPDQPFLSLTAARQLRAATREQLAGRRT